MEAELIYADPVEFEAPWEADEILFEEIMADLYLDMEAC